MTNLPSRPERGEPTFFARGSKVDVDTLILKASTALSSSSAPFVPAASAQVARHDDSAHQQPPKTETKATPSKIHSDRFTILWPHPPYYMELSSSEGSPSGTTQAVSTPPHNPTPRSRYMRENSVSPSPSPMRNRSPVKCLAPSPTVSEVVDWVEFSSKLDGLDEHVAPERGSSWDSGSWDDEDEEEARSPIIITPEISKTSRYETFQISDLTSLLHQNAPPTPPSSVNRTTSSKSPERPAVSSVSAPSTPLNRSTLVEDMETPNKSDPGRPFIIHSDINIVSLDETAGEGIQDIRPDASGREGNSVEVVSQDVICAACGKAVELKHAKKVLPCEDTICDSCCSSTLSAVSVTQGHSHCPACLRKVSTFERLKAGQEGKGARVLIDKIKRFSNYPIPVVKKAGISPGPIIMRIDNVAWDITPSIVERFLPPNTLSDTSPQPIHIPINRFDGRTKDYLYIEVESVEAGRTILQTKQNTFMPGGPLTGGKKRPVTITPVAHTELLAELRPHSSQELHSLFHLCQAALGPQNASTRFIKSRHGPFYALMSTMSKLMGQTSPAYWDVFHVASVILLMYSLDGTLHHSFNFDDIVRTGAIALLGQTIYRQQHHPYHTYNLSHPHAHAQNQHQVLPYSHGQAAQVGIGSGPYIYPAIPAEEEDQEVLDKLLKMFERCFRMSPRAH